MAKVSQHSAENTDGLRNFKAFQHFEVNKTMGHETVYSHYPYTCHLFRDGNVPLNVDLLPTP